MNYLKGLILTLLIGFSLWYFSSPKPAVIEALQEAGTAEIKDAETKPQQNTATQPSKAPEAAPVQENLPPSASNRSENKTNELPPTYVPHQRNGVPRDENGNLVTMREDQARKACEKYGMQLPTIRELVAWGGRIFEPGRDRESEIPPGFSLDQMTAINPDGKTEEFSYVYNAVGGSIKQSEILGSHFFFSSSRNPDNTNEYLSFNNRSGYVSTGISPDPDPKYQLGGVRCVPKKRP